MKYTLHWILFVLMIGLVVACGEAPAETVDTTQSVATAVSPEEPANTENMVSEAETAVIEPTLPAPVVVELAPTEEPPVEEAPAATVAPAPTDEPVEEAVVLLAITELVPEWTVGTGNSVAGTAPHGGEAVAIQLVAGAHLLVEGEAVADQAGNWQVELLVPYNVTGVASVQATVREETAVQAVQLLPNAADPSGVSVTAVLPTSDSLAVSGAPLLLAGNSTNLIGRKLTMGFLFNDCTEYAASQTISLDGDSVFWNGMIILPRELPGDAGCVTISTGSVQAGDWRELLIPIQLVGLEDEAAQGLITLGNHPDLPPRAGSTVTLYGTAVNIPSSELTITLVGEGDVTQSLIVTVDTFGYWEAPIQLLPELVGNVTVQFHSADGANSVQSQSTLEIAP
jgi:hypothetical protein